MKARAAANGNGSTDFHMGMDEDAMAAAAAAEEAAAAAAAEEEANAPQITQDQIEGKQRISIFKLYYTLLAAVPSPTFLYDL